MHECNSGYFDRTICPEPCGMMHYYCTVCGARDDTCVHDEVPDKLQQIRDILDSHPVCDKYPDDSGISCGWKSIVNSIQNVMRED